MNQMAEGLLGKRSCVLQALHYNTTEILLQY